MKTSAAALSFLIVTAALGSQAQRIHESVMEMHWPEVSITREGFHSPADCCLAYTPRKIRCEVMKDYFETSTGCSQPGVIFLTKRGQRVCANPLEKRVRDCMRHLKLS